MKLLFGRHRHGYVQRVANDLGEPVRYWPHLRYAKPLLVLPQKKHRGRKGRLRG